ncbi:hypothetical protein PAXRUDRAFT_300574 [Paxillus rubicundulus Ve08.2h10]|uniref:Uncharacterized protein n=1 Tax=Paxillus rubicundulus Ve08.2h10 TaxID=930991 RepID=A0A0D0DFM9_9AGAM|nr:hypothetical protein PAXRUDRAFT_300574 [Paxillus rubicundulus Ve08.2h10]
MPGKTINRGETIIVFGIVQDVDGRRHARCPGDFAQSFGSVTRFRRGLYGRWRSSLARGVDSLCHLEECYTPLTKSDITATASFVSRHDGVDLPYCLFSEGTHSASSFSRVFRPGRYAQRSPKPAHTIRDELLP